MVSHTVTDGRWIRHVLMAVALTLGAWGCVSAQDAGAPGSGRRGAPQVADPIQQAVDQAVAIYERGEFGRAERAFGGLVARGVPAAAYNLGVMHLRGEAAQPDPQAGLRLLTRAAEQGFVTAQVALGQGWEGGRFGRVDLAVAQRWYRRAAEAGSVEAQLAMGTAHYLGRGERKDAVQAANWYREAAKGGDVGAQYLLASMYEQGDGVPRDLRLARYWYDAAARNGDDAAPLKVREIDARLETATRPP